MSAPQRFLRVFGKMVNGRMPENKSRLENIASTISATAPLLAGGVLGFYLSKNPSAYNNMAKEIMFRAGCTFLSAALLETAYKVADDIVQTRRNSKEMIEKVYGARK